MTERKRHPWPHEELADDFTRAVCGGEWSSSPTTMRVGVDGKAELPLTLFEISEVVKWHISYHGQDWAPGDSVGTELSLHAVLKLRNGQWASVVAGNDYTGWGCQDFADVRIGDSEEEVARLGLDAGGRAALGYEIGESK